MIDLVICTRCKKQKPTSDFFADKRKKSGLQSWCKPCMSFNSKRHYDGNPAAAVARARSWAKRNPERVKGHRSRRRFAMYGITEDQFAAIVNAQGGRCAICENSDVLVVDHCHRSGRVRGALCQKCNKGIGLLGDDADRAEAAAKYLREHSDD